LLWIQPVKSLRPLFQKYLEVTNFEIGTFPVVLLYLRGLGDLPYWVLFNVVVIRLELTIMFISQSHEDKEV
jgi:hypothetical protein